MTPATIEAAYEGSGTLLIGGVPVRRSGKGGVLPGAARSLVGEGHDPETIIRVRRKGAQVFADATLGAWAGVSVEEGEDGTRFVPFRQHSAERAAKDRWGSPQEAREAA